MKPTKDKARSLMSQHLTSIYKLKTIRRDSSEFKRWWEITRSTIASVFGHDSPQLANFENISYGLRIFSSHTPDSAWDKAYLTGLEIAEAQLEALISEIDNFWPDEPLLITLNRGNDFERGYAFIAMPINSENHELEDVLDSIKEGANRCGIRAERIDEEVSNERITDRILESIAKAEYVIVDLSNARPNVFYEAGYAQGIGKTPIYLAKEGTKLEFDLKDYPVIFFKNMKQLKDKLEERLRGIIQKRQAM